MQDRTANEPKWTPGPWVCGTEGLNPHLVVAPASGRIVARADFSGNRSLIAAAPDLYEALQAVSGMLFARPDMIAALHPMMGPAEHAICNAAAAALAKARGE